MADYKHIFRETYPYIECSDEVLTRAYELTADMPVDLKMDLMRDFILSNDLVEEVML